jgi:putative spermidine/putrescine transport system substrate-binding protein
MKRVSRRDVIKAAAGSAAALSLPIGFPAIVRAQSRQIVIGGPGGQLAQTQKFLIPAFEKQHNCKVLYDGGQTLVNAKKIQSSPAKPPFDVVMMDEPGTILLNREKLLEPLKPSQVKNLSHLVPNSIVKDGAWVLYYNPAIAIGYNSRGLPDGLRSWNDLWDPKLKERVMIPHPKTTQGAHMLAMASHLETGKPIKEAQYDLDAAFRKLRSIRANLLQSYLASAQASILLEKGEALAAAGFFTTYVLGRKAAGVPIDMARPKEGSFAFPKVIAKVRNAANPELADAWIDACLGEEFQKVWMREFYGSPVNAGVAVDPSLIPSKDLLVIDIEWHTDKINEASERFDREMKL